MRTLVRLASFLVTTAHCMFGQSVIVNGDFSGGLTGWTVVQPPDTILPGTISSIQFAGRTNASQAFSAQVGAASPQDLEQSVSLLASTRYDFHADVAASSPFLNSDLGTISVFIGTNSIASIWLGYDFTAFGTLDGSYIPDRTGDALLSIKFRRGYNPGPTDYVGNITLTAKLPYSATASVTISNGLLVAVSVTDGAYAYTNTPVVRIIGGGGSGAQAVAVVSNGVVVAVNILNSGYGYTNTPLVVIEPPFIPNPVLAISPMSFLSFSNLTTGGQYQLQHTYSWYWSNQPVSFTATSSVYAQMVGGVAGNQDYRLALNPVPSQAFASPEVVYGFVVHATVDNGGSGYVTSPLVSIVGGGGSNATAVSVTSGGVVTAVNITDAGIGYTNTPTIEIAPPPAAAVYPMVQPVMRVDASSLAPYDNYQIQFKPTLGGTWVNWNDGLFSPTNTASSQRLFVTNGTGFFRLKYVP